MTTPRTFPEKPSQQASACAPLLPKMMVPAPGECILPRPRLHDRLDKLLDQGHVWIEGPPGAGKTMLAAGYIQKQSLACLWYEIDQLDTDPVCFFSSFGKTFASLPTQFGQENDLPDPHPDDMNQPALFARRFFRKLFARHTVKWLLVLDNLHELPHDSAILDALAICLQEIPLNCRALLLSREPAPPVFARLKSGNRLLSLGPNQLCFTREEIGQVLALHRVSKIEAERYIDHLLEKTAGWAAGLTLLLRNPGGVFGTMGNSGNLQGYQELFDYFTGVVFAELTPAEKELLIRAALLPEIRPDVLDRFTGTSCPCRPFFLDLSRKNFFVYMLDERGELFQFHPLFRKFLHQQAALEYPDDVFKSMQLRAAEILRDEGRHEEAIDLLLAAGEHRKGKEAIKEIGMNLLARGRLRTLDRWRETLPSSLTKTDPWLLFYFGNAAKSFAARKAIAMLRQSLSIFSREQCTRGALLACATLCDAIVSYLSDMSALDSCLEYLLDHLDPRSFSQEDDFVDILIANGLFRGLVMRRPDHPDLDAWQRIVIRQGGTNPAIVLHQLWTGRFAEARSTLDRIYAKPEKVVSQLQLSVLNALEIQYYLITAQLKKCTRAIERSLGFIRKNRVHIWEFHLLILGAGCCLNCGERKKAESYLDEAEKFWHSARLLDQSFFHVVKTLAALLDDDLLAAERHQQASLDMAMQLGMPSYAPWCWQASALVALFQGNDAQAKKRFKQVLALATTPGNPWFICQARLGLAWLHLRRKKLNQARQNLSTAFSLAREHNYLTFFFFLPKMMTEVATAALEHDIEVSFVQRFIRHWQLVPDVPPLHLDNWPWQIRILTLGTFEVYRGDKRIDMEGRVRKKPVQLLQALIALGGHQVSKARLGEIFWPDSDGDEQAASLKTTLYRLRKILAVPDVIVQKNKTLSLNAKLCWVDCWQFEQLAETLLFGRVNSDTGEITEVVRPETVAVKYSGEFLGAHGRSPWLLSYRQRLEELHQEILRRFILSKA